MSAVRGGMLLLLCLAVALGHPTQGNPHPVKGRKVPVKVGAAAVDRHGDSLPALARARLGTLRFRHGAQVIQVCFATDGKTLLSIDASDIARWWETATGKERYQRALPGRGEGFRLFTPDMRTLITRIGDRSIQVQDTATGKRLYELTSSNLRFQHECLTPNGKTLLAVGIDDDSNKAIIRVWDLATGKHLRDIVPAPPGFGEKPFAPDRLLFVADGKVLAGEGQGLLWNVVRLWDFASGKQLASRTGNLILAPNGKVAATVLGDRKTTVRLALVKVATGKKLRHLKLSPQALFSPSEVVWSPDSKTLAAWSQGPTLWLWDVASGKRLPVPTLGEDEIISQIAFAPDSRTFAVGTQEANLCLHDVATGKRLHKLQGYSVALQDGDGGVRGSSLAFSADGKLLAASRGNAVRVWNTATGKEICPVPAAHEGGVNSLAVSPDGKLLASAAPDCTVRLWELGTEREVRVLATQFQRAAPDETGPSCIAFSPDGRTVAAASRVGEVYLWDAATGKSRLRFRVTPLEDEDSTGQRIVALVFTADGRKLITGADRRVSWWDASHGHLLQQFLVPAVAEQTGARAKGDPSQKITISPEGRLLAAAGQFDKRLRLWEVASGELRKQFSRSGRPVSDENDSANDASPFIAFSPDGKTLAWNRPFGVQLWDLSRRQEVRLCGGQGGTITGLAFAPREGFLAAASSDGTVRCWDPATGTVLGEIYAPRGHFESLAFSPDGKTLITGGSDTTVLLWDVERLLRSWRSERRPPSPRERKVLWERLASPKGTEAGDAIDRLLEMPKQAVALLGENVKPAETVDARRLARLLADLEAKQFKIRKQATAELEKLADRAEPFLRKALGKNLPLEVRLRIRQLLERLDKVATGAEQLRLQRAVEVLEQIGTREARVVLNKLAGGAASRLTKDARMSLERLSKNAGARP